MHSPIESQFISILCFTFLDKEYLVFSTITFFHIKKKIQFEPNSQLVNTTCIP